MRSDSLTVQDGRHMALFDSLRVDSVFSDVHTRGVDSIPCDSMLQKEWVESNVDTVADPLRQPMAGLIHFLSKNGVRLTENNEIRLLKTGHEKFIHLFDDIRHAKHHIHLEYFNFRNDSIANALFELLIQKAAEGVEVRALYDSFGNLSNNRPLRRHKLRYLRSHGLQIYAFDPIQFPYINHVFSRDHRKIAVIDGRIGYTGGMNIADYYIKGLPELGDWRDMHLRIEGGAVSDLQEIFLTMWSKTTGREVGGSSYYPDNGRTITEIAPKSAAIVERTPQKTPKVMRRMYIQSIDAAQHRVQIVNPYFVPTCSVKRAIERALDRGVDVEIMIPGKSDIPFTPDATLYVSNKLRKKGAEIYIYQDGFYHAKTMVVDDSLFCTVGSTNLNSRSLRYDYEVNAWIFDKSTSKQLSTLFNADKGQSKLLTEAHYKELSAWKRFVGWFAHLFTPFL